MVGAEVGVGRWGRGGWGIGGGGGVGLVGRVWWGGA